MTSKTENKFYKIQYTRK